MKTHVEGGRCEVVVWIHVSQDRAQRRFLVYMVVNVRVP
jgi:hypothetical protein